MLAIIAATLSLAAGAPDGDCRTAALDSGALASRLEQAAVSPAAFPRAERACLATEAGRRLGFASDDAMLQAVEPDVPPILALGRSNLFEDLAELLREHCIGADCNGDKAGWTVEPVDQSERGFVLWLAVAPDRKLRADRFAAFLKAQGADGVAPLYQILRTASDWQACGGEPFEVPPDEDWPRAVRTLGWIQQRVKPAVGAVEIVSGFRDPELNRCAEGAAQSAHLGFWALDLEPLDPAITRAQLMQTMCATHKRYGQEADIGLGFYAFRRFHIDDERFRHWGFDPVAAPACAVNAPP